MSGDLPVGMMLDNRYRLQGLLGRGGYATVYQATQLNIDRPVAIKVLTLTANIDNEDIERFLREARAAARIHHPNVVTIHDVGCLESGSPYIVMEPFAGRNLKRELRLGGPLKPDRCLRLFIGCLDALAKAHEAGVIHRDLKPGNLIVTDPGTRTEALKVIDFGIARLRDEQTSQQTGSGLLGTPAYLSPEYIKDHLVTPALDVYQMGLILVESLSGAQVVRGETPYKCIWQHASGELDLPPTVLEGRLGEVVRKALHRDHLERYPHAAALRDALEALDPAEISVTPVLLDAQSPPQSSGSNELSLAAFTHHAAPPLEPPNARTPSAPLAWPVAAKPNEGASPRGGRKALVVAGALVVVVGLLGGLAAALALRGDAPALQARALDLPEPEPEPEPPPEPPPSIAVQIEVTPPEARIWEGDVELGQGSAALEFDAPQDARRQLRLEAPGHEPQSVEVGPDDAPHTSITLTAIKARRRAPTAAQSPPKKTKQEEAWKIIGE